MKKTIQKGIVALVGLCVLVAMFNFIAPLPASGQSTGDGCYGYSIYDEYEPSGWWCVCAKFKDCWRKYRDV